MNHPYPTPDLSYSLLNFSCASTFSSNLHLAFVPRNPTLFALTPQQASLAKSTPFWSSLIRRSDLGYLKYSAQPVIYSLRLRRSNEYNYHLHETVTKHRSLTRTRKGVSTEKDIYHLGFGQLEVTDLRLKDLFIFPTYQTHKITQNASQNGCPRLRDATRGSRCCR